MRDRDLTIALWCTCIAAGKPEGLGGDTINVASRLEGLAKELDAELVISEDLASRAGLDLSDRDHQIVQIRGRAAPLGSWIISEAESLGR